MQPVRSALPAPLLDWMSQMPFPALQGLFDGLLPKGMQWYWKGDFVRELTDRRSTSIYGMLPRRQASCR
jgi:hypothetical protein